VNLDLETPQPNLQDELGNQILIHYLTLLITPPWWSRCRACPPPHEGQHLCWCYQHFAFHDKPPSIKHPPQSHLALIISQLWFYLCCVLLVLTQEKFKTSLVPICVIIHKHFPHLLMSFPLLDSSTYVKVFLFESMFRFHFNNPGHHARRKLLNK